MAYFLLKFNDLCNLHYNDVIYFRRQKIYEFCAAHGFSENLFTVVQYINNEEIKKLILIKT